MPTVFALLQHSDILDTILLACSFEPATLNALRLVCTATEQAVDAFHCRAIRLHFVSQGPPSPANIGIYLTTLDPLDLPRERMPQYAPSPALAFGIRASVPPDAAFAIHPAVTFALNHAAYVSVYLTDLHHDHFWSMQASQRQLAYHSPVQLLSRVECLAVYHCGSLALGTLNHATINLPANLKELRLTLPGGFCHSKAHYNHSASVLTLSFPQHVVCVCGCATRMLNSSVRHLRIVVRKAKYATAYLETLKHRVDLHPSLCIDVFAKQQLAAWQELSLGQAWSNMVMDTW
ncbi:hypothetical protein A1Q1_07287 [Trichosporon asahii var. asahii CBS 2479]|uniref:Uncharacterized protein n=1 Tax=Trichosporon asahii var. asahii (strain ATCC 90039 / CBS 2479 / JCM 2466 / KCTC 7840 / NBRC 103889/ NCYC 2677 / UAMH 7654) TaxID=1186058 RepID=J4UIL7_TRIAS|nr:hypothetical protein A1Q1_07287 [Trichosporon asahii var. asahii CBS 2479]EJT51525.1 hypothetical protein A1Q1_07287 [Trichosporon asahii var. asahii CBS 2479]